MLCTAICFSGCTPKADTLAEVQPTATAPIVQTEEPLLPIYASELNDGVYEIEVESSSSMFRVVNCQLIVENNTLNAVMTMSGKGYGKIYAGTIDEALAAADEDCIGFVLNENGEKTFTVPVEALDKELKYAAWSIKKEKWYDRTLVFKSNQLPQTAFSSEIADGVYSVDVMLNGGSGKTTLECSNVKIENNKAVATVVWSSPFYEYMIVNGEKYLPLQSEGNSTFEIPIVFDEEMHISAQTVAMSEPHLIDYTVKFESKTLKAVAK